MGKKVCILTSAHPSFDTRIFHKQAKTLVGAGYDVTLIAEHDKNEVIDDIKIIALPRPRNRFWRMLGTWRVLGLARRQKADVYHFHDPELLLTGLLLRLCTKGKVIYDVHEDYPKDIVAKRWIPHRIRRPAAIVFDVIERTAARGLDCVIAATDAIARRFASEMVVTVNNYPILIEIPAKGEVAPKEATIICAGSLSEEYGIIKLIEALDLTKAKYGARLLLVGRLSYDTFEKELRFQVERNRNIQVTTWLPQSKVFELLSQADIGAVLYQPVPNHIDSQPNKLFECMMFSLPVVASDFPLWKKIVEANGCGLNVDPTDPEKIARAIEYIIENPSVARRMGENGRKVILEKYNWEVEARKLIKVYERIVGD